MGKISLAASLIFLLSSNDLFAGESYLVYSPQNIAVFEVRFFDIGDGPFMANWPEPAQSTWNLNQQQKDKIVNAMRYWAEIITPVPGELPTIVNVGTFNDYNAAGYSEFASNDVISLTQLQAALNGIDTGDLSFGSHAQFIIGKMDFDDLPYFPAQLPRTGRTDLTGVAVHELAHGLGITNMAADRSGPFTPAFVDAPFGSWTAALRDDNGNPARPGQVILCRGCNNAWDGAGFDVRKDKGYFTGEHVDRVLAGAMPGIPVKMLSEYGGIDGDYMSHIELKNSLMSHQNYRNYTTFMEAELALLQDLGYQIDRRNFFGFSLYGDGKTLINQHGYFRRNDNQASYINGAYNMATLGLGLHVYGSNNHLFQQADLLTAGAGGAGMRIDGENNTIVILPATQVHADGFNGRGVMFAYGKNHNLIQRGDVQALGINGIALSFDFGNNLLGNDTEYRGSWIHEVNGYAATLLPELKGALVDKVDISGRVAGKDAAIYISENALVNHINILKGANISGDIYSAYSQQDLYGRQRLTALSFGRLADSNGRATQLPDPHFQLRYQGNIQGIDNLAVSALGGVTSISGSHQIYSLYIAPGATLAGYSDYTLHQKGTFTNQGHLIPGNSLGRMSITGRYRQGETGELRLGVDGRGRHDALVINGHAEFNGRLTLVPQRDWYAPNWRIDARELVKTTSHSGQFSELSGLFSSPTLRLQAVPGGNNDWQLRMLRDQDAYSRYARNRNDREIGRVLDSMVSQAPPGMQNLYRALDFSAANGAGISSALPQLSSAAYSAMFASSLHREQQIANMISGPHSVSAPVTPGEEWRSFAIPFGGGYWQQRQQYRIGYDANSYGIVFGAEKQSAANENWAFGFHGAVSGQAVTMKSPDSGSGKTTAFDVGLQARYGFEQREGGYLFGNARLGVENGWLERRVRVEDYRADHRASWNGTAGSVMTGGGYRFALNENLSAGPVASLNYTLLHRRSATENGNEGSRLKLDAATFDSLRSSIGVQSSASYSLASGATLAAELQLSWDRELLDTNVTQRASFAGYATERFSQRNQVAGRNGLGVKTGLRYQVNKNVELGAAVSSELFRSGYDALSGNLTVNWHF